MATYAIGDIQGCFHAFQALLEKIAFNPQADQLWLVGDLVNRGSGSLQVLRWCYQHRDMLRVVLGNHDLHALALAYGFSKKKHGDTLDEILCASDKEVLLDWLRKQPLLYADSGYVMVHAGLLPQWTVEQAASLANEVQHALMSANYLNYFAHMYGNEPTHWYDGLVGQDRLRFITNVLTRMRVCSAEGVPNLKFKGELNAINFPDMPWFTVSNRKSVDTTIVCGHWSALGLMLNHNVIALDTGCLWGGELTAICLETRNVYQVPSHKKDQSLPMDAFNW